MSMGGKHEPRHGLLSEATSIMRNTNNMMPLHILDY